MEFGTRVLGSPCFVAVHLKCDELECHLNSGMFRRRMTQKRRKRRRYLPNALGGNGFSKYSWVGFSQLRVLCISGLLAFFPAVIFLFYEAAQKLKCRRCFDNGVGSVTILAFKEKIRVFGETSATV